MTKWTQRRIGSLDSIEHQLTGTPYTVEASGGRTLAGYRGHGQAIMTGMPRAYYLKNEDRIVARYDRLKDARAAAERRAIRNV